MIKKIVRVKKPMNTVGPHVEAAVNELIDIRSAVYVDDIMKKLPQYSRWSITRWLKQNGFVRPRGQNSKRYVRTNICNE